MKDRIKPYSYSLNHFYWRKILAWKEKNLQMSKVSSMAIMMMNALLNNILPRDFLLCVSTVILFYAAPLEIQF